MKVRFAICIVIGGCCAFVEEAQHTLWVGTRGGSLGALNIIRERGQVLELKETGGLSPNALYSCMQYSSCIGLGRHCKESIKGFHFHQNMKKLEKHVTVTDFSSDGECITIVLNACLIVFYMQQESLIFISQML